MDMMMQLIGKHDFLFEANVGEKEIGKQIFLKH